MQQLKFILVATLLVSCLADDMKKQQSKDPKIDQTAKDAKPSATEDPKTMKDAKSMPSEASKSMMDHAMMDSKTVVSKMMEPKTAKGAPTETKPMQGTAHNDGNNPNSESKVAHAPKSKEEMKAEASVGLGFYAGVVPIGQGGYGGYRGYGYSYPYYRSYYDRPYYGYPIYRPIVPVVVKPRPVPLLLG